ncbi:hypothetical protein XarjCFBP7645_10930 [Xanthomonas arboricola]|uniref:Uncharacterized protein n=1 Tax=Xanthomonas arboricola TaxID=56448 RepID=A0A2S7AEC6_9XANT|nr:hypothetical protein XarjCFBP7645_10930 [Xanthomonas arboricola]
MDAAPEPTRTYLRRVPQGWAGKGPAAKPHINRSARDGALAGDLYAVVNALRTASLTVAK